MANLHKENKLYMLKNIILGMFTLGISISSLLVITSLKPMSAIFALICTFLNGIGLFILLGEDFIGLLYCIIYIGAIVILFLFIIMLINIQRENLTKSLVFFKSTKPNALLIYTLFILIFSYNEINTSEIFIYDLSNNVDKGYGITNVIGEKSLDKIPSLSLNPSFAPISTPQHLTNIGEMFYKNWGYEMLLVISLILLVAMIGAIILTSDNKKINDVHSDLR